jgi:hypothetical protein
VALRAGERCLEQLVGDLGDGPLTVRHELADLQETTPLAVRDGGGPAGAVAKWWTVAGQHQVGLQRRDAIEGIEVGAHRVGVETAFERHGG